jgi:hypothetical protein
MKKSFDQGKVISINRVTGRVSVSLRNGLIVSATYIYDINTLFVGNSVIVTKVSNAYVILNKVSGNVPIGQSSSVSRPSSESDVIFALLFNTDNIYYDSSRNFLFDGYSYDLVTPPFLRDTNIFYSSNSSIKVNDIQMTGMEITDYSLNNNEIWFDNFTYTSHFRFNNFKDPDDFNLGYLDLRCEKERTYFWCNLELMYENGLPKIVFVGYVRDAVTQTYGRFDHNDYELIKILSENTWHEAKYIFSHNTLDVKIDNVLFFRYVFPTYFNEITDARWTIDWWEFWTYNIHTNLWYDSISLVGT